MVKRPSVIQETWVRSLGREDPPGGRNGNPLQYSCLENPVDRGAWWAKVHVVTQSRTQLKRLSMHASEALDLGTKLKEVPKISSR